MISIQHSSSSSKIQSYFFKVRCKFHQNISSPLRTGLKIIEDFCQQTNSDETISSDTLPRSSTMSHSIVYVVLQVCKQYINHYMISIQHSSSSSKIQSYFFKVRCKFHQNISSPLRTGLKIIEDFCQQTNSDETISSDTLPRSSTMSHSIVYVVLQVCKQ